MNIMNKIKVVLLSVLIIVIGYNSLSSQDNKLQKKPYVVILSMDGFRWDYPEKVNTPNLDFIQEIGVRAKSIPCFPTKTFPNHYSIATGLYPENHGLIFNRFYAPDIKKQYAVGNRQSVRDSSFYFGEPIWVTAEKQGVKSASYFWVGSETTHDNILPTYNYHYDGSVPFEERLDGVIEWLELPEEKRPQLILWYIQEPDDVGHHTGPNGQKTKEMIVYLDGLVGLFHKRINELDIAKNINIVITSDHGMGEINKSKTVYLDQLIDMEWIVKMDGANPVYSLDVKEAYYDTLYSTLSGIDHVSIWKKSEVPGRLHFSKSERIKDFVVVADRGWSLLNSSERKPYSGGVHGYDNRNQDMHAIFYAYGPAFKEGYHQTSIDNIDIYPLICKILNLDAPSVDGNIQHVIPLLKED